MHRADTPKDVSLRGLPPQLQTAIKRFRRAGTAPLLLSTVSLAPGTAPGRNTEKGSGKCLLELIKNIIILFNHTHTI